MQRAADNYLKLAIALFVCAAAFLSARVVAQLSASMLWMPRAHVEAEGKPAPAQRAGGESEYQSIAARNLFNDNPPPPGMPVSDKPAAPAAPAPQPFDATLVATVVKGKDNSFAVFTRGDQTMIRHPGMEVSAGWLLSEVAATKVTLLRDKEKKEIELFADKPADSSRRGAARSAAQVAPPAPPPASTNENIKQVSSNSWAVDRKEIDLAMSNLTNYMMQIRLIPNQVDGQHQGFRVANIVPGSIFTQIGLLNGDVLKEINGTPLNGFEASYQLMNSLPTQSSLQVKIERNGMPMNLSYEIR